MKARNQVNIIGVTNTCVFESSTLWKNVLNKLIQPVRLHQYNEHYQATKICILIYKKFYFHKNAVMEKFTTWNASVKHLRRHLFMLKI